VPSALASDQVLLLPLGKLDGPVWHSGLSGFPALKLLCPANGRRVRNGHLLCSSLHSQNPTHVLTILGGSASTVAPIDRTTLPKDDKVDISSMEVPTARALVTRPESKRPDDNVVDDDPNLLNFAAVGFEVACRTSSRL
jgi:hypothetical protein